jgi:TonB family protein
LARRGTVISTFAPAPFNRRLASSETQRQTERPDAAFDRSATPVTKAVDGSRDTGLSQKWRWLLSSLAVAVLALATFFLLQPRLPDFSSNNSRLGLKLTREGSDWRLSWNPDAPILRHAVTGRLLISDGVLEKNLDLDISELRGGAIIYAAITNDVVFRLEVNTEGSPTPARESVRVAAGLPSSPILIDPIKPVSGVNRFESEVSSRSAIPLTPGPVSNLSEKAVPTDLGSQPKATKQVETRSPVPLVSLPEVTPDSKSELSSNQSKIPFEGKPSGDQSIQLVKAEKTDLRPSTLAGPAESGQASKLDAVSPEIHSGAPPAHELATHTSDLEPAQLIARKEPIYPPWALQSHVSGTVEVHFYIETDGTVHDVSVVRGNHVLAKAAADAVKMWRYKPARLGGTPIRTEGSAVLNFN